MSPPWGAGCSAGPTLVLPKGPPTLELCAPQGLWSVPWPLPRPFLLHLSLPPQPPVGLSPLPPCSPCSVLSQLSAFSLNALLTQGAARVQRSVPLSVAMGARLPAFGSLSLRFPCSPLGLGWHLSRLRDFQLPSLHSSQDLRKPMGLSSARSHSRGQWGFWLALPPPHRPQYPQLCPGFLAFHPSFPGHLNTSHAVSLLGCCPSQPPGLSTCCMCLLRCGHPNSPFCYPCLRVVAEPSVNVEAALEAVRKPGVPCS